MFTVCFTQTTRQIMQKHATIQNYQTKQKKNNMNGENPFSDRKDLNEKESK